MNDNNVLPGQLESFENVVLKILEKHAPQKLKYIRNNQAPFITKKLRKEIMTRSRLLNKFRIEKSETGKINYNKQRNYCVSLLRKQKKSFYNNLNVKSVTDNKLFWTTVKPCFSDKSAKLETITLVENGNVISNDKDIAEKFNHFWEIF